MKHGEVVSRSLSTQFHPVPYLSEVRQIKPVLFKPKQLPVCVRASPRQKEAKKQQALKLAEAKAAAEKAKKEQEKAPLGRWWRVSCKVAQMEPRLGG